MRTIHANGWKAYANRIHKMICIIKDDMRIYDLKKDDITILDQINYPTIATFDATESFMYVGTTENYIHVIDMKGLVEIKKYKIDMSSALSKTEYQTFEITDMTFSNDEDTLIIAARYLNKHCILLNSVTEGKIVFFKSYDAEDGFSLFNLFNIDDRTCILSPSEIINKCDMLSGKNFNVKKEIVVNSPAMVYRIKAFSKRKGREPIKSLEFITSDERYLIAQSFNRIYILDVKKKGWAELKLRKVGLFSSLSFKYNEARKLLIVIVREEERVIVIKLDSTNYEKIWEFNGYYSCCFYDESLFLLKAPSVECFAPSVLLDFNEFMI